MSAGFRILAQCLKASAPPGRQDPNVGVSDNRVVRLDANGFLENGREPRAPSIEGAKLVEELFVGDLSNNVGGQEAVHPTLEGSVFLCPDHCEGSLLSLANFGSEQGSITSWG